MQLRSVKIINELNVIILSLVTRIEMGVDKPAVQALVWNEHSINQGRDSLH